MSHGQVPSPSKLYSKTGTVKNQLQDKCKLAKANYDENLVKNFGVKTRSYLLMCIDSDQLLVEGSEPILDAKEEAL